MGEIQKMINKLIIEFEKYLINEEKSKATIEKYMRDVQIFNLWLSGKKLCKPLVLEYKQNLTKLYAPKSINSIISALNTFFNFISRHDCKIKALKIQRQIFSSKEKELTKSEYKRLLNEAKNKNNDRLFYLLQTICSTGIRVSEDI